MKTYRLIFPDFNGACRGKLITEEHYSATGRFGMPRSVLTADIEGTEVKALPEFYISNGDEDMFLVPDESTLLSVPYQDDLEQVIVDLINKDGSTLEVAPRALLKQILSKYQEQGLEVRISSELEFYLLNPDGSTLTTAQLEMPYGDLNSLDRLHGFTQEVLELTRTLGLKPEMVLKESGAGQLEVTFSPTDALFMADRTLYYKQLVKDYARRHDMLANFMAKPFKDDAGSGGHVHVSIWKDGRNLMSDDSFLAQFVAGQLRYMRALMAVFVPNPNSYRRLSPDSYAAGVVNYGEEDRNVSVRIVGQDDNRHVEHRLAGADKNAYLVFAAILAAGLAGINNNWTPETPEVAAETGQNLPSSLAEALALLPETGHLLGDDFVRIYSAIKRQELELFDKAEPGWELAAYGPQV